ncbi:MAG: ATP synthase F0 subunit B [Nitrospirota bacterium]
MLELNKWFFVLLLNFLVLLYLLNVILFKPLLRLFTEREGAINNSLNAARDLEKKKDEAVLQMNRELQNARSQAMELFENMRIEGLNRQRELLDTANSEASGLIDNARTDLKKETGRVRQQLRADAEKFSDEIVRKLIGV